MTGQPPDEALRLLIPLLVVAFCLIGAANAAAEVTLPPGFQAEPSPGSQRTGASNRRPPSNSPRRADLRRDQGRQDPRLPARGATKASEATVFANLAKQTFDWGDHGMLGLALDPKFDEGRPYVYALYSFNHELGTPAVRRMPEFPSAWQTGLRANTKATNAR